MTAPILRFKDQGRSYPDWVEKKIKDCVTFSKGGSLSKSDLSPHGATPCLLYGELYTTYGEVTKAVINKTDSTEDLVKSQMNDVILPMSGETAEDIAKATCIKQEGVAYGGDLMVLRSKSLDGCFLSYSLNSVNRRQISRIAQGKTVVHINPSRVSDISINIACLEEQQKIAAFFTALDEKIACEAKRVEKIKLVKKSCLQKIFGEEMHFSDSTPWVETSFGEVSTFVNGRAYAQNELLSRGKYLVLRVGNFFTNSEYYYSDLELDEDKYANDGDLLYAWSASFGPRIWNGGKIIYHYHIWKVVPKNIDKNFLFYALQHDVDGIKGQLNGGTMSHLTKSGIEERVIKIPCDNEQKKIGEFLKLLDEKALFYQSVDVE